MLTSPLVRFFVLLLIVSLIAFGAIMLFLSRPEPTVITINPPIPTATDSPTATPKPIMVYITGEVLNPEQIFALPNGSRIVDAIDAAGGFTELANKSLVNLAGVLRDGDHFHVPSTVMSEIAPELPTPLGGHKVFINSATRSELEALPNVGPALAERIVKYREEVGPFKNLADLDNVSGIGQATLDKWRDLISFS